MLYQLSHFRSMATGFRTGWGGAESQNRTGDPVFFSHVLYQLSYLGASSPFPAAAATSHIEPYRPAPIQRPPPSVEASKRLQ